MAKKWEPREPTFDLEKGVGRFRWGDDKKTVKKAYPKASWTVYEALYLLKRVYFDQALVEVDGTSVRGAIDPGADDAEQVVVLYVDEAPVLAPLAAKLGMPDGMVIPEDEVVEWDVGRTHVELKNWAPDEMSLYMVRPKDAV